MNKYSQYNEESFLSDFFGEKKDGVVVEIGAAYVDKNSNSKLLIEKGWRSLLVEPNTIFFKKLKEHYKENQSVYLENVCAYSDDIDSVKFYEFDRGDDDDARQVSTMDDCFRERVKRLYGDHYVQIETKAVKTSKLIEKYFKHVDFLSIDTEGSDMNVILGIDFESVYISLLCHESQNSEQIFDGELNVNEQIYNHLKNKGFQKVYENSGNIFYENIKNNQ
jgi:FkbM family methyltransferase